MNIGVWIAPLGRHQCFNNRLFWDVIFRNRIMEAALVNPDVAVARIPLDVLHHIGSAARDVIGGVAGQCRSIELVIDLFRPILPDLVELIDPWPPIPWPDPPPWPWVQPMQLLDIGLGAAIVALRQRYPYPVAEFTKEVDDQAAAALRNGAIEGLRRGLQQMATDIGSFSKALRPGAERLGVKLD